ncbi:MAG: type II secretion system protein GspD [Woeseiaceae bacterium]
MSKQTNIVFSPRAVARMLLVAGLLLSSLAGAEDDMHRISMTMKDADLADVMDMISREQRVNIFVSTESNETVSFSLYDMTLPAAIRSIANSAGFAVEHYDGNYFIVDRDDAGKYAPDTLTQVRSFQLEYVSVEEMRSLLEPYLSEYGEMTVFAEKNIFLIQDTPEFLQRTAALVREIDKQPTQILIEAKILEVTLTDEDSSGLDWTRFFSSDGGTGEFGGQGLNNPASPGLFFSYTNDNITLALDALTSQGRVRTLSSPKLLAVEDRESSVIIGDRRGYSVITTINQVTSESIEFLESGVILRVTASVDANGKVLMDIHPEVSNGVINPLTGIPSQTTTEVTTRMIVPDGKTIFVGGLIKHRIEESKQGIPIVSRVPGLGRLFSSRENNKTNTETIVLITPTILGDNSRLVDEDTIEVIQKIEQRQSSGNEELNDEMERFF